MWLLVAPELAVLVSPYYKSSFVIGNGAASIAATNLSFVAEERNAWKIQLEVLLP